MKSLEPSCRAPCRPRDHRSISSPVILEVQYRVVVGLMSSYSLHSFLAAFCSFCIVSPQERTNLFSPLTTPFVANQRQSRDSTIFLGRRRIPQGWSEACHERSSDAREQARCASFLSSASCLASERESLYCKLLGKRERQVEVLFIRCVQPYEVEDDPERREDRMKGREIERWLLGSEGLVAARECLREEWPGKGGCGGGAACVPLQERERKRRGEVKYCAGGAGGGLASGDGLEELQDPTS